MPIGVRIVGSKIAVTTRKRVRGKKQGCSGDDGPIRVVFLEKGIRGRKKEKSKLE